jgi:hypothetical protein
LKRFQVPPTILFRAHVDCEIHPKILSYQSSAERVLQIEFQDSLQKFRIKLVLEASGSIQPNLSPPCPQPFLKDRPPPNHALGEIPSQEFSGKTVVENKSDGARWVAPSADQVAVGKKIFQRGEKLPKTLRCSTSNGRRRERSDRYSIAGGMTVYPRVVHRPGLRVKV